MTTQTVKNQRKILKARTRDGLMKLVNDGLKSGWKMISEIKCDHEFSKMFPYQVLVQRESKLIK